MEVIAFTGAQGTGKTTMRNELDQYLHRKYSVLNQYRGIKESISRDAKKAGFGINLEGAFDTQWYIMARYIAADLATRKYAEKYNFDYIVVDRSILDVLPYSKISKRIDSDQYMSLSNIINYHLKMYTPDYLVYCEPLDTIVGDKDRLVDKDYQKTIDESISQNLSYVRTELKTKIIYLNKDSIVNRLQQLIGGLNLV